MGGKGDKRYAMKLKAQRLSYTEVGGQKIDINPSQNGLRSRAAGRKNWMLAGPDCGGERAAAMYSLLETAKLNGVKPQECSPISSGQLPFLLSVLSIIQK